MRRLLAGCCVVVALGAAACTSEPQTTTLTVFAAASLKGTFTEIGRQFEADHPGTTVQFNFAGSSDLVTQLQQGAQADLLATADAATMSQATDDDLTAAAPETFATNTMTIAVPPGNPAGIERFADLADDDLTVVVCAPQVPCGAATKRVERKTGVTLRPVSEELAVTSVLEKVAGDEADAGVVYVTDVKGADDRVDGVSIPQRDNTVNAYPIATLRTTGLPTESAQFQEFVTGPQGRKILAAAGFGPG